MRGRGRRSVVRMAPWRRAPLLLARSPGVLAAMAAAGFLLALAVASRPVFLGSAEAAAVQSDLKDGCRYDLGLRVQTGRVFRSAAPDQTNAALIPQRTRLLADATRMPGMQAPVVTLGMGPVEALSDTAERGQGTMLLVSRTGAFDYVHVRSRAPGDPAGNVDDGLWLPDTSAAVLHVHAGDVVPVDLGRGRLARLRIAAVFDDLTYVERDHFWCTLDRTFEPLGSNPLPPVAIVSQATMVDLLRQAGQNPGVVTYEAAPADGISMLTAERVDRRVYRVYRQLVERRGIAQRFGDVDGVTAHYTFPDTLAHARLVGRQVRTTADTVGAASTAIALVAVAGAGFFWVDRRRGEVGLLLAKGVGPGALAVKALLESAAPLVVGAAAGAAVAVEAVYVLGPADAFDPRAVGAAARLSAFAAAGALVLLTAAAAVRTARAEQRMAAAPHHRRVVVPIVVAGAAALALAAAAAIARSSGYTLNSRGSALGLIVVVFPLLVLAGGAGLLAALGHAVLPRTRRRAGRWPTASYLAIRRVAAAGPSALALSAGAVVSVGILLYASVVAASARATVVAKATISVGSDNAVFLTEPRRPVLPLSLATRATPVMASAFDLEGTQVDVLGIDPATFAHGAFWDRTFSGRSLPSLLRALHQPQPDGAVPVLVVAGGDVPDAFDITAGDRPVPARAVARVDAFPGMSGENPMIVAEEAVLRARGITGGERLWVRGRTATVVAQLDRARVGTVTVVRAKLNQATSSLLPLATSLGYFKALGLLGGAVTLSGAVFYLASRERARRLAAVMARGMGLTRRSSRRALLLELAGLLVAGLAVGAALAAWAARVAFPHLDPSPGTPPPLIFRWDLPALVATAAVAVLAAAGLAAASNWTSWRRPPAEVVRDA